MIGDLSGQVAVVTGGNRGIGRAIATALRVAGAAVAIGSRSPASVQGEGVGEDIGWIEATCDVRDEQSVDHFAKQVLERFGRVDTVIANAGVPGPIGAIHELSPDQWRQCIEVDLTGVFLTFRAFTPHLIGRRTGSLIAISSATGKRPLHRRSAYAAAKMGVIGLVRTVALELGPFGVRANCICPGSVEGARMEAVLREEARFRASTLEAVAREGQERAALQRFVYEHEVAQACIFLASAAASGITGEDLNVSAGEVMY